MSQTNAIQKPASQVTLFYGDGGEITSLAKRIKIMVPGGNKLSDGEAQALAQISYVTQLNPFIGEVWYIPEHGPMIGIKGARRCGNEQIEQAGGKDAYWFPDLRPCSGAEAGYKGDLKDLAAAYICVITDSVSGTHYQKILLETINALRSAGSKDPVGEAREIVGKKPEWIGYGFSTVSEKSRMNKQALAQKRAEADALKRKFDIPFGAGVSEGENAVEAGAWVEGQANDLPEDQTKSEDPMTYNEAKQVIVITKAGKEKFIGELTPAQLERVASSAPDEKQRQAAEVVLEFRNENKPEAIQQ